MERYLYFKTINGSMYVYDSETNLVFNKRRVEDINFIKSIEKYKKIKKSNVTYCANDIEKYLYRNGLKELLLEVTTSCNLRCKYCMFSGNYIENRKHGNEIMKYETAKKAIEYYLELCEKAKSYNPYLKPMVGFYGGEPLINFNVIKKSIEYIRSNEKFKDVLLTVTTNGTLLTKEIIDFLIENNVLLVLSLDGPCSEHDRNRVYSNENGTFNDIIENIQYYIERKGYIFTNSVYDIKTDLNKLADFFDNNSKFISIATAPVNENGTEYYKKFTQKDREKFSCELDIIKINFYEDLKSKNKKRAFLYNWISKDISSVLTRIPFGKNGIINYTGGCVPGDKMFVNINSEILICEKLNDEFNIGNINDGLNYKKIANMINLYNLKTKVCEECILKNCCSFCFANIGRNGEVFIDHNKCLEAINSFKDKLSMAYSALEINDTWLAEFNSNYYKEVGKVYGK